MRTETWLNFWVNLFICQKWSYCVSTITSLSSTCCINITRSLFRFKQLIPPYIILDWDKPRGKVLRRNINLPADIITELRLNTLSSYSSSVQVGLSSLLEVTLHLTSIWSIKINKYFPFWFILIYYYYLVLNCLAWQNS